MDMIMVEDHFNITKKRYKVLLDLEMNNTYLKQELEEI